MEHLLSVWQHVARQLIDARHIMLMSDYDGTLTPIVARPELANLAADTRRFLQTLARQRRLTVAVISGRALPDLKAKVNIGGIIYAGNHGLEIEGPGIRFVNPLAEELRPVLRVLHQVLSRAFDSVRGVLVEDKGLTLSVHYRLVEGCRIKEVKSAFERLVGGAQALGRIRVTNGKKVYEVRPAVAWDKGKAIKLLMKRYGRGGRASGLFPMYFGDDLTDEDGFKVIEQYGKGLSVFIGEPGRASAARYYLESAGEMTMFLSMFLEHVRRGMRWAA